MNKRFTRDSYFFIVIITIAVLAVSAFVFTQYLEDQTQKTVEVSTFLSVPSTTPSQSRPVEPTIQSTTVTPLGTSYANEILQLLSESINDETQIEVNYREFNRGQLDDISLEEYQLYTRLLRSVFGRSVESYSSMTYSEWKAISSEMILHDSANAEFLQNVSYHWLEAHDAEGELIRMPIVISRNSEGQSYLSREWVRACLELRNYSTLYFGAFLEQNLEAALRLTYSASEDPLIRQQKTQHLLDYYSTAIGEQEIGSSEIVSIRMDSITFRIPLEGIRRNESQPVVATFPTTVPPTTISSVTTTAPSQESGTSAIDSSVSTDAVVDETTSQATTNPTTTITEVPTTQTDPNEQQYHLVTIYKRQGSFVPVDIIPASDWKASRGVTLNAEEILVIGQSYSLDSLQTLLGMPSAQASFYFSGGEIQDREYLRFVFNDAELIMEENAEQAEAYTLMGVTLNSNRLRLGNRYWLGQSLDRLLQLYLYIDTVSYSYQDSAGNTVRLNLNENNLVGQIEMNHPDYQAAMLLQEKSPDQPVRLIEPTPTPSPTPTPVPTVAQTTDITETGAETTP